MEGILYKWTNYISGWQPRWFVLEGGTLSYYDSQEDSWKGCKGSIKISVCEIQVHSSDFTRVDLTIPGEQYFYLRAINAAERQKWLVALGSAKACLTDNRTKREKEYQENTEALKTKMSELRLYCDLLLQQVNQIKDSEETEEPGENSGTMVKSTCTTFLKTLEECMLIANRTFSSDQATKTPPGQRELKEISEGSVTHDNQILDSGANSPAGGDHQDPEESVVEEEEEESAPQTNPDPEHTDQPAQQEEEEEFKEVEQEMSNAQEEEKQEVTQDQQETVTDQEEAKPEEEEGEEEEETEQTIVLHEVQTGVSRVRNSATEALMWLKRGLKFLKEFLSQVNSGERDIPGALGNAYGRSLRQYHGWVVRAPSYSSFAAALVSREGDELKEGFNTGMHRDLGVYLPAMEKQLAILDALYEEYNLESEETIWDTLTKEEEDRRKWRERREPPGGVGLQYIYMDDLRISSLHNRLQPPQPPPASTTASSLQPPQPPPASTTASTTASSLHNRLQPPQPPPASTTASSLHNSLHNRLQPPQPLILSHIVSSTNLLFTK
ncbi:unnamed protein product [Coregonus sp. 'balchen']|nr:unnamed protein product [Coregonus sp. 'balchen']